MQLLVGPETGAALAEAIAELVKQEPELPYSNFAPVAARPGAAQRFHRDRWAETERVGEVWVARARDGHPNAALGLESRPFESAHFGLRMAKLDRPLAVGDKNARAAALRALYPAVIERARERGEQHLAARASTRDRVSAWVLQEQGAVHVDTQVSWMAALSGTPHDEALPAGLQLEIHAGESLGSLDPRSWKRLAEWGARAFDRGPLVFDLSLPEERARAIYSAWTEKALRGEWADAVLLVRHAEEVVAFISMRHMPDLSEAADAMVCGRGLGATLPEYRGLFTAIQREMIAARPLGAHFMENETQVATLGSINVYAKLGFRYLRSTGNYHLHLDRARAQ